jgi:hypothetical protein
MFGMDVFVFAPTDHIHSCHLSERDLWRESRDLWSQQTLPQSDMTFEGKFQKRREAMTDQTRFLLNENDIPKYWYNINADSPVPPTPVLHPGTLEPVTPDFLSVLFPWI